MYKKSRFSQSQNNFCNTIHFLFDIIQNKTSMTSTLEEKAKKVVELLENHYSIKAVGIKKTGSAFQFLVAVILSAQSTDKQVNAILPQLFKKFPTPKAMANAPIEEIEEQIKTVGLYKNKAKFLKNMAKMLLERYDGDIPKTTKELIKLPGVGRKSANVLLNDYFGIHEGVAVDTHVRRISYRLGLTKSTNPVKIEIDLKSVIPRDKWGKITKLLIAHGRNICKAIKPKCDVCFLNHLCDRNEIPKKPR